MRRLILLGFALVLAVGPLGSSPRPAVGEPQSTNAIIDDFVDGQARRSGPGVAVAVIRDGKIIHTAASGDDGRGTALDTDTPMRVESVSKSFTAAAVMQLAENGTVNLDEPVHRYLPEFRIADPRGAAITVRQLLTQTSGMTDATGPDLYRHNARTLRQAVARLSTARLATPPGTAFAYHNPNYHVLARMVEVLGGQSFADYLEEHIFRPAGMTTSSDVSTAHQQVPDVAAGHLTAFGHPFRTEGADYFVDGSGGVVTTAEDMARWLILQSNGGRAANGTRIVSRESVELMHRPQSPGGSDYGFGWYTAESAEGPPVRTSHSGAGAGFGAYEGLFRDSGWGVAVLVNHGAGLTASDPGVVGQNLLAAVDSDLPALEQRRSGPVTDIVLAVLTVIALGWAVVSLARARRWAFRRVTGRRWSAPLLLVPQLVAIGLVWSIPRLQLWATQRTAPWRLLFSVEPVAVVLLLVLGVGSAAVLIARVGALVLRRRRQAG